jgi:prepilin-type N-terminal cleavage/methylation domain-containing protein
MKSTLSNLKSSKSLNIKSYSGFTMVELLMVMGIIGVLAGFVLVSYPAAQKRARDANRKSDIKQYQTAMEVFANKHDGFYPDFITATDPASNAICVTKLGFTASQCPSDIKDAESVCDGGAVCGYKYISNGTGAGADDNATEYVIWGALEQPDSNTFWGVCSTGQSGEFATEPTNSSCPL